MHTYRCVFNLVHQCNDAECQMNGQVVMEMPCEFRHRRKLRGEELVFEATCQVQSLLDGNPSLTIFTMLTGGKPRVVVKFATEWMWWYRFIPGWLLRRRIANEVLKGKE